METVSCIDCEYCEREMEAIDGEYFMFRCRYLESYGISSGINIENFKNCKVFKKKRYEKIRDARTAESKDSIGE